MHKTTITFDVLSEEPIPEGRDIAWIVRECDEGDYVMNVQKWDTRLLTRLQMRQELLDAGSEPGFFMLDE